MTDILCRWLNEEITPHEAIAPNDIAGLFSSGYLFGSLLHKHGVQDDFAKFTNANTTEAKLNNFFRLEPTFSLLDIRLNSNIAQDVMMERQGVATRLLYQLYVALQRKQRQHLTGQSLRCMKPTGKSLLESVEKSVFHGRMKQTPRQVDLNFKQLVNKYQEQHREREERILLDMKEEEERLHQQRRETCQKAREKAQSQREAQAQMYARLKPLPTERTSPAKKALQKEKRTSRHNKAIAEAVQASIDTFESTHGHSLPETSPRPTSGENLEDGEGKTQPIKRDGSEDYMAHIAKRVQDNSFAQKEREKRRRKVLMDQMRALRSQEESRSEELLVSRMLRQCQQEQRIATQLMQVRKEKDNIRNNRIELQRQFEERRQKDFEEYLKRQAELVRCEREQCCSQLEAEEQHHRSLLEQKQQAKRAKRVALVQDTLERVLDLAVKMCHYKEETNGLLPAKLVRDWKIMFIAGQPLSPSGSRVSLLEVEDQQQGSGEDEDGQLLLDDQDFSDYHGCHGYWSPPAELTEVPSNNTVLSHLVHRLQSQVNPPKPPPDPPKFPHFQLKAACVGRPCSGSSLLLQKLSEEYGVVLISVEKLVERAILAHEEQVESEKLQATSSHSTLVQSHTSLADSGSDHTIEAGAAPQSTQAEDNAKKEDEAQTITNPQPAAGTEEDSKEDSQRPHLTEDTSRGELPPTTTEEPGAGTLSWAGLGCQVVEATQSGCAVPDATLVHLVVLHLRELQEGARWVLVDFPTTLEQATLLEIQLSGYKPPTDPPKYRFTLAGEEGVFILIDPPPEATKQALRSGLDIVIHMDTPAEVCLQQGISERDEQGDSPQQLHPQLSSFDDAWPELSAFYNQFNNVVTVDGGKEEAAAFLDMKTALSGYLPARPRKDPSKLASDSTRSLKQHSKSSLRAPSHSSLQQPSQNSLKAPSQSSLKEPSQSSLKGHSQSSLKAPSQTSLKGPSQNSVPKVTAWKEEVEEEKAPQCAGPGKENGAEEPTIPAAGGAAPTTEADIAGSILKTEPESEVEPGSDKWQYVERPVPELVASALAPKWSGVEQLYVSTCMGLFRLMREGREEVYMYFANRRREYRQYLRRPDHKQEFLVQWQQNYNALPTHLRAEDVMKAELHCRVDDLCNQLWDICDHRKQEAVSERLRVMTERWLEDKTGLLSNYYFMLLQAELSTFYETVLLQRDYYHAMEDPTPPEPLPSTKVPLIEMPVSSVPDTASMQHLLGEGTADEEGGAGKEGEGTTEEKRGKVPPQASKAEISKSTSSAAAPDKVALIPEQVPVPDSVEEKGGKKKGGAAAVESPPPVDDNVDISEAIVKHVINKAKTYVTVTVDKLTQSLSLPALPVSPTAVATPVPEGGGKDKGKGKAADKKGKKTPVPTKKEKASKASGKGSKVPPPEDPPPATPVVDIKQREILERMRKEELASLKWEAERVQFRIDLLQDHLMNIITDLKSKAEVMYVDMEEWLSQQYEAEVESVSRLAEVLREAVEDEQKVLHELALPETRFTVNQDSLLFEVPAPPPLDPPTEEEAVNQFTIAQLSRLVSELKAVCPSGVFPTTKSFVDVFKAVTGRASGSSLLPLAWEWVKQCDETELAERFQELMGVDGGEHFDWRRFIVVLAQPLPLPSPLDVTQAAALFAQLAPQGLVDRDDYIKAPLWLDVEQVDGTYNRPRALKQLFFDVFVSTKTDKLHWTTFLFHLCVDPDPTAAVVKALSVATGATLSAEPPANDGEPPTDNDEGATHVGPIVSCEAVLKVQGFAQPNASAETSTSIQELFAGLSAGGGVPSWRLFQDPTFQQITSTWSRLHLQPLPPPVVSS